MKGVRARLKIILRAAVVGAIALVAFAGRAGAQSWPTWTADCTNNSVPHSVAGTVTWTPALCQEFNEGIVAGSAVPMDQNKVAWAYDTCTAPCGEGNNEIEAYCPPPGYVGGVPAGCPTGFSTATNTEYVDSSGHLVIQAYNPNLANPGVGTWYSARVKSELVQNFMYGRIESSIELPNTTNQGLWPAFWSLGTDIDSGSGWPTCGEADIMEVWSPQVDSGPGPGGNRSTIHTGVTVGVDIPAGEAYSFTPPATNDGAFHAYGVIWSYNMMQFYVDDPTKPFFIATPESIPAPPADQWPFNAKIFLITNIAVGGTLGGTPSVSTPDPGQMLVDYVRQYTPSAVSPPNFGTPPAITVTAGATTGNTSTISPTPPPGTPPGTTWYSYIDCTTNAPAASCSISTNDALNHFVFNLTQDSTITVTFASTARRGWLPYRLDPRRWGPRTQITIPALFLFALLLFIVRRTGTARGFRYGVALGSLVLIGTILASCGGNGSGGGQGNGTTAGAYTITVNAFTESNTTGTADATATVNVTVN
ncbi:MAG: glycoside hydrolase family 16 protein [Candidatus Acidiferrales bacterium]